MTYSPNHDRDYWRCVSTRTLVEAARDSGHELAIVLGERLDELDNIHDQHGEMLDELTHARRLIDALRDEIASYETGQ